LSVWILSFDLFVPEDEGRREALCTLGNGYFATRGAAPEARADGVHYPGTYVAGCFDRLTTEIAGRSVENEDLVNVPNWLPLSFRLSDGAPFDLGRAEVLSFRQALHLRGGMLSRTATVRDGAGHVTTVDQRRFVHMEDPHLAAVETIFTPVDWSGRLILRSGLDGDVPNAGVARYRSLRGDHLVPVEAEVVDPETVYLQVRTRQSRIAIAEAARTRLWRNDEPVRGTRRATSGPQAISQRIALDVERGDRVRIEKIVTLYTSKDPAISEAGLDARLHVARAAGFVPLMTRHAHAWGRLWRRFDVSIEGSTRIQLILRLHAFHLLQTVSPNTIGLDAGLPARGLHGEAYRGHVFWDELFILPFLDFHAPALTESLLGYRHRRLRQARYAARAEGYRGAMYPWQSGSSGREETQALHLNPRSGRWVPDHSRLQRHVDIAIAYNLWHHFQVTGDVQYLNVRGAPIFLEIARFWASLATPDKSTGRFGIRGVMGPDEYHDAYPGASSPGLDNNAYTNVMVAWTFVRALELLDTLPDHDRQEVSDRLELDHRELSKWDEISRRLVVPFLEDGIISQFEGYGELEELDWTAYVERYGNIQRLDRILEAEGDSTNRYKVSKQADVLMLFYLLPPEELQALLRRLGYAFDPGADIPRTIDYYLLRTSHGSSLSRVVHAWVLARYEPRLSWEHFNVGLKSDIADVQGGTTAEGIHLGAMVGTLDLVQRCYGGVEVRNGEIWIRPFLPSHLKSVAFPIDYRARRVTIHITADHILVRAGPKEPGSTRVRIGDEPVELPPGGQVERGLPLPGTPSSGRRATEVGAAGPGG